MKKNKIIIRNYPARNENRIDMEWIQKWIYPGTMTLWVIPAVLTLFTAGAALNGEYKFAIGLFPFIVLTFYFVRWINRS